MVSILKTEQDTIYALSSGVLPCAIAIIRISGNRALEIAYAISGKNIIPRKAIYSGFYTQDGQQIDDGILLYFPSQTSITGEDLVEFQTHGSNAVVHAFFKLFSSYENTRPAEAGEFTKRAVIANRLSLDQAEAIGDLIHANDESQRKLAMRQLSGKLKDQILEWRSQLTQIMAMLAAEIDFADDEDDVSIDIPSQITAPVDRLASEINEHIHNPAGLSLQKGLTFLFLGPPNVGKSSLINKLANEEVAIVTEIAGTTRDFVTAQIRLGDHLVSLKDAPGLRISDELVESIGIQRVVTLLESEDESIIPVLVDAAHISWDDESMHKKIMDISPLHIINKCDIFEASSLSSCAETEVFTDKQNLASRINISAKTGQGIAALREQMQLLCDQLHQQTENSLITNQRHLYAMKACNTYLANVSRETSKESPDVVLISEDLRQASQALGRITGDVDIEDLLDIIFRDFCVGK